MATTEGSTTVAAVIVSYNRRELLLEAVAAVEAQTVPAKIVVVDNASTDGSADAVEGAFPDVRVIRVERNVGGAGGFAVGLAAAAVDDAEWIWLMDDDTVPTPTALAELLEATGSDPLVDIAGSRVVWTDGQDHPMNTPREKPLVTVRERAAAAGAKAMAVRSSSFVSMLVRGRAVAERGLPIADYFIWNDDFEYSTRLLRGRRGLFVPASVVVHKTKVLGSTDADPGARFYYEVRNKLWLFFRSRSLSPWEKAVYGASTVRRWVRTIVRSAERPVLLDGLVRGVRDGVRGPRSNSVVLDGLGEATAAVLAVEKGARGRGV
jgi:rhamnopyranosyl-N-acetylglucosaminyl-diphospho-decaprenol beta-1,3/1,4-galactofuranosyltransferase